MPRNPQQPDRSTAKVRAKVDAYLKATGVKQGAFASAGGPPSHNPLNRRWVNALLMGGIQSLDLEHAEALARAMDIPFRAFLEEADVLPHDLTGKSHLEGVLARQPLLKAILEHLWRTPESEQRVVLRQIRGMASKTLLETMIDAGAYDLGGGSLGAASAAGSAATSARFLCTRCGDYGTWYPATAATGPDGEKLPPPYCEACQAEEAGQPIRDEPEPQQRSVGIKTERARLKISDLSRLLDILVNPATTTSHEGQEALELERLQVEALVLQLIAQLEDEHV